MNSPRLAVGAFVLGVFGAILAIAWVTVSTLRLEQREAEARAQNRLNESVRLVLWRMDSALTPIIAREAARPYFEYDTFYQAPVVRPRSDETQRPEPVFSPSPLIRSEDRYARLYFQRFPDGRLVSPQAPAEPDRAAVAGVFSTEYDILAAEQTLKALSGVLAAGGEKAAATGRPLSEQAADFDSEELSVITPPSSARPSTLSKAEADPQALVEFRARQAIAEQASNVREYARAPTDRDVLRSMPAPAAAIPQRLNADAADSNVLGGVMLDRPDRAAIEPITDEVLASGPSVTQGAFVARWIHTDNAQEPELLLERTVTVGDESRTQGVWLNWPEIKAMLEEQAMDLLPGSTLRPRQSVPAAGVSDETLGRLLAAIPAELVLTAPPRADPPAWSPARTTLLAMWVSVLLTLAIWALVLRAAMELAERRGRFVSAVTHELRTPLTTFCLYSQMLADGLVQDESARQTYFNTLKTESQRLSRIVESVLDYARLGGRNSGPQRRRIAVKDMLNAMRPPLIARGEQSGAEVLFEGDTNDHRELATDPALVERIIFNLVDNACKYGASSGDRRVHVVVEADDAQVVLSVRDHGPGVTHAEASAIFRPFFRGQSQSHGATPGLGLGLAIAQGLAIEIDAELSVVAGDAGGHFQLTLARGPHA